MYSIREIFRRNLSAACPLCDWPAPAGDLCARCEVTVRCEMGVSQLPGGVATIAATHYTSPADQLMRTYKEGGRLNHAGLFARLLWSVMRSTHPPLPNLAALVPIPADILAAQRRGFNPACEIAVELSRLTHLPVRRLWLTRTRSGESQKSLNRVRRRYSVCDLYVCDLALPDVWVGLVDDVTTTGSTLEAAADALRQAGVRGVVGLVGAKTPLI